MSNIDEMTPLEAYGYLAKRLRKGLAEGKIRPDFESIVERLIPLFEDAASEERIYTGGGLAILRDLLEDFDEENASA